MLKGYGAKILLSVIFISILALIPLASADLVCSVVSSCAYTDLLHLSNHTNAHAELTNASNYGYHLCCFETQGVTVGTSCSGTFHNYLKVQTTTNAHVEKSTESAYPHQACIDVSSGNLSCTYATSCYGYDTCLASISSTESGSNTNLHISDCESDPYTTKICCTTTGAVIENYVTFEMEFNISGNADDQAYVDSHGVGFYENLTKKYACLEDTTQSNQPAFGIAFGGRSLKSINLSSGNSYRMEVAQYERGNRFILPVTINNCNSVSSKAPVAEIAQTFVEFVTDISTIELTLSYPAVDISGDFQKSGAISIVIEKNETDEGQIVISPV